MLTPWERTRCGCRRGHVEGGRHFSRTNSLGVVHGHEHNRVSHKRRNEGKMWARRSRPSKALEASELFPKGCERTIICIERQKPVVREKVPPSKPWQHLCFLFSLLFKFSFFFSSLWPLTCSLIYLFPLSFHTAPLSKTHCRVLHIRSGTNKPIPTPSVTIHQ